MHLLILFKVLLLQIMVQLEYFKVMEILNNSIIPAEFQLVCK